MIQISEPITLEKLLPLIQKLPKVEREQLRKSLEAESQMDAAIIPRCQQHNEIPETD